jgi:hypothetical protein
VETERRLKKQDKLLYLPTDHGKEIGTMMEIVRAERGKDSVVVDLSKISLSVSVSLCVCLRPSSSLYLSFIFTSLHLSLYLSITGDDELETAFLRNAQVPALPFPPLPSNRSMEGISSSSPYLTFLPSSLTSLSALFFFLFILYVILSLPILSCSFILPSPPPRHLHHFRPLTPCLSHFLTFIRLLLPPVCSLSPSVSLSLPLSHTHSLSLYFSLSLPPQTSIGAGMSGVFDKFMGSYVLLERQNLDEMLQKLSQVRV